MSCLDFAHVAGHETHFWWPRRIHPPRPSGYPFFPSPQHAKNLRRRDEVLLESSQILSLLLGSLVRSVAEFGRSIDPLEVDLLESFAGCMCVERFAEGNDSLLDARDGALEKNKVILDFTVMDKATQTERKLTLVDYHCDWYVPGMTYGVICLLTTSNSVAAFFSSVPLPMR